VENVDSHYVRFDKKTQVNTALLSTI